MPIYFGSELVAEAVYTVLSGLPAVQSAVVDRIVNLSVVPQGVALPALLHYMEAGTYDGAIGQAATVERLRYVVRVSCEGQSTDPIKAAAEAAFAELDGAQVDLPDSVLLTFQVSGEWPLTTVLDGGVLYRQLGFYLDVELTQGG